MSKVIRSIIQRHKAWICCFENRTEGSNGEPDGSYGNGGYGLCEDGTLHLLYTFNTGHKTWCIYKTENEAYEQAAFQMVARIRENKTSYVEPIHTTVDVYPITFTVEVTELGVRDNGMSGIDCITIEKQPEYERLRLPDQDIKRLILENLDTFGHYKPSNDPTDPSDLPF